MPDQWQRLAELFILPPGINLLALLIGLALIRRRIGRLLAWSATLALLVFSLPAFANLLFSWLEPYPALDEASLRAFPADAIVVLTAGQRTDQPEYGGRDVLSPLSLERLRYAAWLHHRTHLPVIVSGGQLETNATPLALLAADVLERQYQVHPVILENHSRTTRENARYSADLLRQHGWKRIYLVTHAWHMPRAVETFRRQGVEVIPAPTAFAHRDQPMDRPADWLPSAKGLLKTYYALHEMIGRLWYRISD